MAQSVPQRKVVDQGPWWLLAVAAICAGLSMIGSTGLPAIASLVLTLWFAIGTLAVLLKQKALPKGFFLLILLGMWILATYVTATGHYFAFVPAVITLVGFLVNLRRKA